MRCTEPSPPSLSWPALTLAACGAVLLLLTGCAQRPVAPPERPTTPAVAGTAPAPVIAPVPPASPPVAAVPGRAPAGAAAASRAPAPPAGPIPRQPRYVTLPPPPAARSEAELRAQFALRLVAAHPDSSYASRAPDRLLAIPVLETELNADGSVRSIKVLRKPTTGNEATALAIAAVRRAAPYGDVTRLKRPWKVVETFLFDDNLRFKPRTLDID